MKGIALMLSFALISQVAHAQYCPSTGSATSTDEGITNVTFAGINNNSAFDSGYSNFTSISASVVAGQSYPISVSVFNSGTIAFTQTVRVWVDWNQDQVFSTDEAYDIGLQSVPAGGTVAFTSTIEVPSGATAGSTRMRVTNRFSTYALPCDNFLFGEVEDYTVNVSTGGGGGGGGGGGDVSEVENDLCSGAIALQCGTTITGTNVGSNPNALPSCVLLASGGGVWYSIVGTGSPITISTCNAATDFDTQLAVFSGSCSGLTCVGANTYDNSCSNRRASTVTFTAASGTTYYVYVTGTAGATGTFGLSVSTCAAPIPNDLCSGAIAISCGQTLSGTTAGASTTGAPGFCGTSLNTAGGVWYSYTAATAGSIVASLCNSSFDTKIGVFTGTCGTLTCVAGNDDSSLCTPGSRSRVTFNATAGTTYYIYVTGFSTATGAFNLELTCGAAVVGCVNTSQWPFSPVTAPTTATPITITTCAFAGDYSIINNAQSGFTYTITASVGTTFMTVRQGSVNGPVIASGTSPLNAVPTATGQLFIHYNTNSACGTAFECITTTIACTVCSVAPPPPAGCANAPTIACGATVTGSTLDAPTSNLGMCNGLNASAAPGTYYRFTPTANAEVTLNACGNYSIAMAVFSGNCDNLTCVGSSATEIPGAPCAGPGSRSARMTFTALVGTTYYIYVTGTTGLGSAGNFTLSVTSCMAFVTNDSCADAISIACGATVAGSTTGGTNTGAPATCTTTLGSGPGVWYRFTGNGGQTTVSLCGSSFDTKIGVFSGTCGTLTCVAGNDDFCGLQSQVTFQSTIGVQYYVYVTGFSTANGPFSLSLTCAAPPIEIYPGCAAATPITCGGTFSGTTVGGATNPALGTCVTGLTTAVGRWHTFTAATSGTVEINTCAAVGFDTKLGVFTGSCAAMTCVTGNDDAACTFSGLRSRVTFTAVAGTTYYVYVTGFGTASGAYQVNVICTSTLDNNVSSRNSDVIVDKELADLTVGEFFPNPVSTGNIRVNIDSPVFESSVITITDQMGRVVNAQNFDLGIGANTAEVNVNNLPAGSYIATVKVREQVYMRKLIVLK
jgi:hypothetical protein